MDFDEADLLSLAFDSVEQESEGVTSDKINPKSKDNIEIGSTEKPPASTNDCIDNNSFFDEGEDDILALAFKTIEESRKITGGEKKTSSRVGVDLKFDDNFLPESIKELVKKSTIQKSENSVVHSGDTDSSDDEDNKYFEESRYNTYGKTIKKALKDVENGSRLLDKSQNSSWKGKPQINTTSFLVPEKTVPSKQTAARFDPVFGISIVNPLISSQTIKDKMAGRTPINFMKLKYHVAHGDLKSDWVIAAVIVRKFPPRVSQNGSNYSNWILSDLKGSLKTASLFLFGRAHEDLWKTPSGTVLAILNPSVFSDKKATDFEAKLSIKSSDQIMIWGKSKDLGQCNFRKKNGEICGTFVNVSECEFCVYHVQQEYKKFNSRAGLQSDSNSKINLRNKVLGKNEVFYGGKSFTALPFMGKKTQNPKDKERLKGLGIANCELKAPPEKVSIPLLQRSNKMFNMLPSGNSLFPSNAADEKRLNTLLKSEKKCITPSEVKDTIPAMKNSNGLKTPSHEKKPLLTNPGNNISFELELISPKMTPPLNEIPKGNAKVKSQGSDKKKLQKRFSSLMGMSSSNAPTGPKQPLPISFPKSSEKSQIVNTVSSKPLQSQSPKTGNSNKCEFSPKLGKNENLLKVKTENSEEQRPNVLPAEQVVLPSHKSLEVSDVINAKEKNPNMVAVHRQKPNSKAPPNSGMSKAKLRALQFIKNKGPINKDNPSGTEDSKKRIKRPLSPTSEEDDDKKPVLSERFLQLMNQKSIHEDLVEVRETEQEFEYFERMEKKDRLEEKMLNTFKVDCKAVRCLKCNYIWFSASDACKAEAHPIKVVDAIKRFFKCGKCANRTISLTLIPLIPCKKCFSSNWVRAPMIREKLVKNDTLSIRGGEQKFVNGSITNGSLDLLVPD